MMGSHLSGLKPLLTTLATSAALLLASVLFAPESQAATYDPNHDAISSVSYSETYKIGSTRYNMKTTTDLARVGTPSASGCKQITGKYTAKNPFGSVQITFQQLATWCWDHGLITYKYSDYTQTSPGTYWSFVKITGTSSSAGSTPPWIRYRQAYFKHCLPGWMGGTCYNKAYPWFRFYMYGNGTYTIYHGS